MNQRRRLIGAILLIAPAIALLSLKGSLAGLTQTKLGAPPADALLPAPPGLTLVTNQVFAGGGNAGTDGRILVFAGPPEAAEMYLGALARRGWERPTPPGALSPRADICLTAIPADRYVADPLRPEELREMVRQLGRPAGAMAVVTAIRC
jgi:hypothetical protein